MFFQYNKIKTMAKIKMKKTLAHLIFIIIVSATLIYAVLAPQITLAYIVLACAAIWLNFYLLIDRLHKQENEYKKKQIN